MVHPSQERFCELWGQLIARAWSDDAFKRRLVRDPEGVLAEHGFALEPGSGLAVKVVESDDTVQYLYLPSEGELPEGGGSGAAGETASERLDDRMVHARLAGQTSSECFNNRMVLARLAGRSPAPIAAAASPPGGLRLRLRDGVVIASAMDGSVGFERDGARYAFARVPAGVRAALHRLAGPGDAAARLADEVERIDGAAGLPRLFRSLHQLTQRGLLVASVYLGGAPLATFVPISASCQFHWRPIAAEERHALSRFAYQRRSEGGLVLESPLSHARVLLHDRRASDLVHALAAAGRVEELAAGCPDLPRASLLELLTVLVGADLAGPEVDGAAEKDRDPALQTWDFHDLLFHARSRAGRHDQPFGGVYPHQELALPGAFRPARGGDFLDLARPDLARLEREDPPFAQVQESRASLRSYGARPITAAQLGEFLYRVARVRDHREVEVAPPGRRPFAMEATSRPFPGGGGLYELEFYLVVNRCDGVPPGLYHYDPLGHRLGPVTSRDAEVQGILDYASQSTGTPAGELQVMIVLAARFQRLAWKYASCAYALTLKHVGVVFQTMYLAATAMGLAPCALGGGDADRFARAAGTNYYAETSVGEFLLGSRAEGEP